MRTVYFKQWNCKVKRNSYMDNDRVALQLVDSTTGEPIAHATINIPHIPLEADEVIIKDYSENEGMLSALIEAGIVGEPLYYVPTGFVECPVCKLL